MPNDFDPYRVTALEAAVQLHGDISRFIDLQTREHRRDEILDIANSFISWLEGTVRIKFTITNYRKQGQGTVSLPVTEGNKMQIHDDEQFDLTVDTQDAKGFETSDNVSWGVEDNTIAQINVSDDGKTATVVAGNVGSTVITVTDNSATDLAPATFAVDVVAAGTATINLVAGDVTKQQPAGGTTGGTGTTPTA